MRGVRRSVRQKVIAGAAVAVLLAGSAFAAVSATGQRNGNGHGSHGARRLHRQDLAAAATYLGISSVQLARELTASKTLAQIAEERGGKSAQGVTEAIVAARRARLAKTSASLPKRVGAEVNQPLEPAAGAGRSTRHGKGSAAHAASALERFTAAGHLGAIAAGYLAITPAQLRAQLRSGRTLAQVAGATPGKSSAGLLAALVAAKTKRLAAGVAAGTVPRARLTRKSKRLDKRMNVLLGRKFAGSGKP